MKNTLMIIFFAYTINMASQENVYITIPIDSVKIKKDMLVPNVYNIYLNIKSNDKRFFLDQYTFQVINDKSFDELSFSELKEKLNVEKFNNELSLKDLKKREPCKVHEIFSLNKNIFLVTSENEIIFYWRLFYLSTSKYDGITDLN